MNFTENNLVRFRRSYSKPRPCPSGRVCIREIAANEFDSVVLNRSSDTMVFYRKKNCIFCDVGARFFLRVSQMFENYPSNKLVGWNENDLPRVQFVSIDGEENDLPWQFTVEKYPSIIFYPAFRYLKVINFNVNRMENDMIGQLQENG